MIKKLMLGFGVLLSCAIPSHAYIQSIPNVFMYGAKGDGVTDDTANLQKAINANAGNALWFPASTYKISNTLILSTGSILVGDYRWGTIGGTILNQSAPLPIFQLQNTNSSVSENQNVNINGFHLVGGSSQIVAMNGGVYVALANITGDTYTGSNIFMRGFVQQWFIDHVEAIGGNYGLFWSSTGVKNDGVTTGTPMLFDKTDIHYFYPHGQNVNGVYLVANSGTGNSDSFYDLNVINAVQDGVIIGGGFRAVTFVNPGVEGNGYLGIAPTPATTANTFIGGSSVTVASMTGLTIGSTLTIAGAGTNGIDWYPYITQVFTSSITVNPVAPTAVTGAELVNYLYSDFKFIPGANASVPSDITMINPVVGISVGTNATRYGFDGSGLATPNLILAPVTGRPIYDPSGNVTILGDNANAIMRAPNNLTTEKFGRSTFGGVGSPRTQVVSPPGNNITMGLQDSLQNQTGTFGNFEIRKSDSNRTSLLSLNGTSGLLSNAGSFTTSGYVQPLWAQAATIRALTPGSPGQWYGCSDCGTVGACISTGSLVGQWALITNKGSACN